MSIVSVQRWLHERIPALFIIYRVSLQRSKCDIVTQSLGMSIIANCCKISHISIPGYHIILLIRKCLAVVIPIILSFLNLKIDLGLIINIFRLLDPSLILARVIWEFNMIRRELLIQGVLRWQTLLNQVPLGRRLLGTWILMCRNATAVFVVNYSFINVVYIQSDAWLNLFEMWVLILFSVLMWR